MGVFFWLLWLPLWLFIWKIWGEKIYENLDEEYWKSFLMDKIDDYISCEYIKKDDFYKLYELLEEKLWVYKSKEKILTQNNNTITPEWISFSSYIENELKTFINENSNISDENILKEFINYIQVKQKLEY
jgi:hypothetical protein